MLNNSGNVLCNLLIRISLGKSCTISVFDALKGLFFRMKILSMEHSEKSQKSSLHPYACLYIRAVGAMPNEYLGITFTYFQACICIRLWLCMYLMKVSMYVCGISYVFLDSKTQAQSQGITFFCWCWSFGQRFVISHFDNHFVS